MRQQSSKYTMVAIAIHWLMAVVVFALIAIGWFMVDLPPGLIAAIISRYTNRWG